MNDKIKELLEKPFLLHDELLELLDMEEIEYHYCEGEYLYKDEEEQEGYEGIFLDKWIVVIEGNEYAVLEF